MQVRSVQVDTGNFHPPTTIASGMRNLSAPFMPIDHSSPCLPTVSLTLRSGVVTVLPAKLIYHAGSILSP
jgi:hypothetical protein